MRSDRCHKRASGGIVRLVPVRGGPDGRQLWVPPDLGQRCRRNHVPSRARATVPVSVYGQPCKSGPGKAVAAAWKRVSRDAAATPNTKRTQRLSKESPGRHFMVSDSSLPFLFHNAGIVRRPWIPSTLPCDWALRCWWVATWGQPASTQTAERTTNA
jgi:hypothetical protein